MRLFVKLSIPIVSVLILIFAVQSSYAQFLRRRKREDVEKKYFQIQHALFLGSDTTKFDLEVYYQIYNAALNFNKVDSSYKADYKIHIRVYDNDDHIVDSTTINQSAVLDDKQKVKSNVDFRTNQVNFTIPSGKYEIKAFLTDPVSNETITRKQKFKTWKLLHSKPKISDVELVQAIIPKKDKPTVFDKGNFSVIPSVNGIFGSVDDQKIYFYLELYEGKKEYDKVMVETKLQHKSYGMQYRDSLYVDLTEKVTRQFRQISVDELRPGNYELVVTLRGERNKKLDVKYTDFKISWSPKAMLTHDYKTIVNQLKLIAENNELEFMKDLKSYEDRLQAFTKFWEDRDPTPGTGENEAKTEFYRRIFIANENFSFFEQNGWKTDRGKIYVIYGEPDQVDDYPFVTNSHPYQEWYYYSRDKYRKFVFVDENEDGDYRLVYPYDGLFIGTDYDY